MWYNLFRFKNKNNIKIMYKKGFTLIELLVVVAIIAVLVSVVIASLTSARMRAENAAIKSNLKSIMTQANVFYEIGQTYVGVCSDPIITRGLNALRKDGGVMPECNSAQSVWAVSSNLRQQEGSFTHWCVDSTNANRGTSSVLGPSTVCP